jgi:hypothetical protein
VCGSTINTPSEAKKALGSFVYKKLFLLNEWRCCGTDSHHRTGNSEVYGAVEELCAWNGTEKIKISL